MENDQSRPDLPLFLASAAHDMKNLVSMLSGTLENLLADPVAKPNPAYRQMAHMLYETRRMNNNLIQPLALHREVGSASCPFDRQAQSIDQLAHEVADQNRGVKRAYLV